MSYFMTLFWVPHVVMRGAVAFMLTSMLLVTSLVMRGMGHVEVMLPISVKIWVLLASPVTIGVIDTRVMDLLGEGSMVWLVLVNVVALVVMRLIVSLMGRGVRIVVRVRMVKGLMNGVLVEMDRLHIMLVIVGMIQTAMSRVVGRHMRVRMCLAMMGLNWNSVASLFMVNWSRVRNFVVVMDCANLFKNGRVSPHGLLIFRSQVARCRLIMPARIVLRSLIVVRSRLEMLGVMSISVSVEAVIL